MNCFTLAERSVSGKVQGSRDRTLGSSVLIKALQEAYDYKPTPGNNAPPPELVEELGLLSCTRFG
jgi:hypothetical protein